MNEMLLAYALLLEAEFISSSEYKEHLNALFMNSSNNDLLLELEWCSSDTQKTKGMIFEYSREHEIDFDIFGSFLMQSLKNIYNQIDVDIKTFNSKIIIIWSKLPNEITKIEPFWSMSYAGEPLTWGDVQQTQDIYEKMFNFYSDPR